MFSFAKVKALFGDVISQDSELGRKIDEAREKLDKLTVAPLQKADYIAWQSAAIDKMGEDYLVVLQHQINNDLMRRPLDYLNPASYFNGLCPVGVDITRIDTKALCALAGPLLKENFAKAVDKLTWPKDCGPLLADRVKMIADLEREIASLSKQRDDLRQAAKEAGLSVGELPIDEAKLTKKQLVQLRELKQSAG